MKRHPQKIPPLLDAALNNLVQDKPYVDQSTEIFDLDVVNEIKAVSAEYMVPMEDDIYLDAIDELIDTVMVNYRNGLYHTAPWGIRFVDESAAYLSMMHGRKTCTIETPLLKNSTSWRKILKSYEVVAMQHSGRPHWGQYHSFTGKPGWLDTSYKEASEWRANLLHLDPHGLFKNKFTDRLGFQYIPRSRRRVTPLVGKITIEKQHRQMIRALAKTMLGDAPVIPITQVVNRSVNLLQDLDPFLSENYLKAISFSRWFLPLLVGSIGHFPRLPQNKRNRALAKCYKGRGIKRDLGQVIKLLILFPYYTDEQVRKHVGYVRFEDRPRFGGIDLTPSTHTIPK